MLHYRLILHVWSTRGMIMTLLMTVLTMVLCTMVEIVVRPVSIFCLVSPTLQWMKTPMQSNHLPFGVQNVS